MPNIQGTFRAFPTGGQDIALVLDLGSGEDRRINIKPGLNNQALWDWLKEHVRPTGQAPLAAGHTGGR